MQVHRNTVFADACAALLPEAASHMSSGPCIISPAFLAAFPDTAPCQLGSSQGSMQRSVSAGRSQVTGHSNTSTACSSGMDEQSSTAPGSAQRVDQADHPPVVGNISERGVSPTLQEEGEGRGPRKEFFAAIGADITSAGCSPDSSLDLYGHVGGLSEACILVICAFDHYLLLCSHTWSAASYVFKLDKQLSRHRICL